MQPCEAHQEEEKQVATPVEMPEDEAAAPEARRPLDDPQAFSAQVEEEWEAMKRQRRKSAWMPHHAPVRPKAQGTREDDVFSAFVRSLVTVGTPACGAFLGMVGVVLAALLLTIGLGRTLLLAAFCLAGVFVGGVRDKGQFVRDVINRLFPPRD